MNKENDSHAARPVSDQELRQHLDDLFAQDPASPSRPVKATLMRAAQHGIDHGKGSPFQSSLVHLAQLIDQKIGDLRDQGLIPASADKEALEAWGKQVEAWGRRVNQRQRDRRRRH